MPHIPYHPAKGIEGLMPGWYPVPQNPVNNPGVPIAAAPNAGIAVGSDGNLMPTFGLSGRSRSMGEILAGSYPVPQNPIRDYVMGKSSLSGLGCGCNSGGCGCGMAGLGDTTIPGTSITIPSLDFTLADITAGTAGWPTYAVLAVGAFFLVSAFSSGKKKYSGYRGQRAERKAKTASAQAAYWRTLE